MDGVTLLHLAALRSETRMFYLIEQGGDPEISTKNGRNLLHLAARARQVNVVGYLCQVSFFLLEREIFLSTLNNAARIANFKYRYTRQ